MTSKHSALVGGAVACPKPLLFFTLLTFGSSLQAQELQKDLAFPGYSGFLNVPSSTVLDWGQADVQLSDQAYLSGRPGFESGRYGHLKNLSGAFGVLPLIEVGGRLAWDKTQTNCYVEECKIRDLSANIKLQAPFIPEDWFTLAAGAQDFGGQTSDFESVYVVAGKQIGPIELAIGYGDATDPGRYLDGAFGAVSYRPTDWLTLMVEHDGSDQRVGLGLTSPEGWLPAGLRVKSKVLAWDHGANESNSHFVSVGLSMPFGNRPTKHYLPAAKPLNKKTTGVSDDVALHKDSSGADVAEHSATTTGKSFESTQKSTQKMDVAQAVGEKLVEKHYDRVKAGVRGNTLVVQWENNLYNRDERESIFDVAKTVHQMAGPFASAELTLLNQGIPVVTHNVSLAESAPYSKSWSWAGGNSFASEHPDWDFEGSFGPTWKPRVTLSPSISSGVATEYGVWDASVALKSVVSSSLWSGALVSARYDAEIYRTEDYQEGGVFYESRQRTDLIEAEIQQTFKLHPQLYTSFHAGRYAINYDGVLNETLLLSPGGRHAIGFLGGSFAHRSNPAFDRDQMLAQYSYYNPDYDTEVTVYGGQFFGEDTGFRVDSRFWFGDYALTLQYKNTDAEFVSLGWVIPLTPVKDTEFRYLQVKGDADWNYAVQTRINEDKNSLASGGAGIVTSENPLRQVYFNRRRLGR